jgi:hypothetical protein
MNLGMDKSSPNWLIGSELAISIEASDFQPQVRVLSQIIHRHRFSIPFTDDRTGVRAN